MCVAAWVYMRIRFNVWRILCPLVNLKPLFGVFGKRWGGGGLRKSPSLPRKNPPGTKVEETKGGTNTQASRQAGRRGTVRQESSVCLPSTVHSLFRDPVLSPSLPGCIPPSRPPVYRQSRLCALLSLRPLRWDLLGRE